MSTVNNLNNNYSNPFFTEQVQRPLGKEKWERERILGWIGGEEWDRAFEGTLALGCSLEDKRLLFTNLIQALKKKVFSGGNPKPQETIPGFFYKIKDQQRVTRAYFLGTHHQLKDLNMQLEDAIDPRMIEKFNKCWHAVFEIDWAQLVMEEAEQQFSSYSPEMKAQFPNLLDELYEHCARQKLAGGCMDLDFFFRAMREETNIELLETNEFQDALAKKIKDKSTAWCSQRVQKIDSLCKNFPEFQAQIRCYHKLQEGILIQNKREAIQESSEQKLIACIHREKDILEMQKELLDDRNEDMDQQSDRLFTEQEGRFFVCVGMDHLVGDLGLLKRQEQRGRTVEKISGQPSLEEKL